MQASSTGPSLPCSLIASVMESVADPWHLTEGKGSPASPLSHYSALPLLTDASCPGHLSIPSASEPFHYVECSSLLMYLFSSPPISCSRDHHCLGRLPNPPSLSTVHFRQTTSHNSWPQVCWRSLSCWAGTYLRPGTGSPLEPWCRAHCLHTGGTQSTLTKQMSGRAGKEGRLP